MRGFVGNNAIVLGDFRTNTVEVGVVVGNSAPPSAAAKLSAKKAASAGRKSRACDVMARHTAAAAVAVA